MLRHRRTGDRRGVPPLLKGALALALVVAVSCSSDDAESVATSATESPSSDAAGGTTAIGGSNDDRRVIDRDVTVYVTVDDIETTSTQAIAMVTDAGGVIDATDISLESEDSASARIDARVPPTELEAVVTSVSSLGTLTARQQTAADVTDQVVDLRTRIASAQASVQRVQALLDEAQNLDDVVLLEGELTKRQTDLERLEAQQQALTAQTDMAGLVVLLSPTPRTSGAAQDTGIGEALRGGWDGFVAGVHFVLVLLAYLLPFLITGGLIGLGVLISRRRGRRNRSAAPPSPPTEAPGP